MDDLFFEYARLIKGIQPKVFIAENVSGLILSSSPVLVFSSLAFAFFYRVDARAHSENRLFWIDGLTSYVDPHGLLWLSINGHDIRHRVEASL